MTAQGLEPTAYAASIARMTVGVVLIFAAVSKAVAMDAFSRALRSFPGTRQALRNPHSARVAAQVLVLLEGTFGSLFLIGLFIRPVQFLILGLMAGFTLGLAIAVASDTETPCGCFGEGSSKPVTWVSLVRNLGLLMLAAIAGLRTELSVDGLLASEAPKVTVGLLVTDALAVGSTILLWRSYARLRSNPNFVQRVPPARGPKQSDVWEGSREV